MSSYAYFAGYYDELTRNVDYGKQADYLEALCHRLGHAPGLSLDLACGTGSLTVELCRRGWDVCTLDSINHLTSPQDVQRTFDRVSLFLNPGGYFIFDANTIYKHREVLGNNTFVYDTRNVYCVWQNTFSPSQNRVTISLDFFHRDGNAYYRSQESFSERAYAREELEEMLKKAGLEAVEVFHEQSFEPPREASQRLVYAARKPMRK